jgi:hypothetical protein
MCLQSCHIYTVVCCTFMSCVASIIIGVLWHCTILISWRHYINVHCVMGRSCRAGGLQTFQQVCRSVVRGEHPAFAIRRGGMDRQLPVRTDTICSSHVSTVISSSFERVEFRRNVRRPSKPNLIDFASNSVYCAVPCLLAGLTSTTCASSCASTL